MDLANLDKMKVVDLRNELQTRGLDTKGVKAVLIERLRAHLEGGGVPGSPGTPGRRSRRTRSMTKSPSPSPIKKAPEPTLETLEEESNPVNSEEQETTDEKPSSPANLQEEEYPQEIEPEQIDRPQEIESEQKDTPQEKQLHQKQNYEIAEEAKVEEENTNGAEENQNSADEDRDIDEDIKNDVQIEEKVTETENPAEIEPNYNEDDDCEKQKEIEDREVSHKEHSPNRGDSAEDSKECRRSHSELRSRSRSPHSNSHSRSHSRSRSHSPKRRSGAGGLESPFKTNEESSTPEDEPTIEDNQFGLSWFDSDLHLRIDPVTFTSAKPMNHDIYALVWSGARTNYGVRDGKVCFEVRLSEETHLNRDHPFRDEPHTKGFRVGFSIPSTSLLLGESENSFAYCESGRKATNGKFVEFAKPFQLDDVIGCYLDLESTPCTIKYTLNGEDLGVAFEFDKAILGDDQALFPHVITKGYEYEINFADNDNLLVNKERKVRQRRKDKNIEEKKENDKKSNADKEVMEKVKEDVAEKENNIEEKEDKKQKEEAQALDEKADECNKKIEEISNQNDVNMNENPGDKEKAETEEESIDNRSEETNNKDDDTHGEKVESEKPIPTDQDDSGPSPTKRQKLETIEEDEFEEVHPIPREHMSLLQGYELIALIPEEQYIAGPQRPESRKDCEVILMVGLPGAGKTTWVLNHIKDNPDKRYHVIGADALIAKMTVDGVSRKSIHKGRFDRIFELCFNVLTSLEDIAVKRRRNFILDQTNAYASAQRRKMKGFGDFKRIAVVCIPNEEELKRRLADKKEKGYAYTLKESTLNTLQAAFTLPSLEFGWFDDVLFTDLSGEKAKEEVKKYNEKGKKALDENNSNRDKRPRRDNYRNDGRRRHDDRKRHDYRNDNRWNDRRVGGGYNHGNGGGNRWGSGGGGYRNNSGGYRDDRSYCGGGRGYDQRHQRYSNGPQNWVHNNRNRYGDRNNRYGGSSGGGGGGNRYDSYGGGGGSRDYRSGGDHRDHRDRNRSNSGGVSNSRRDSHRSGGSSNQRDFRHGHRDTREDSRGGSNATSATAASYKSSSAVGSGNDGYDKYNKNPNHQATSNYNSYNHQQQNQHNNWSQYPQHQVASGQQQQQQYWNYDSQGYGNQQQQWQTMDPQQQQQWMSWWQQQGNAQQPGGTNAAVDPNQYWSQYSYSTSTTDETKK